MSNLADQSGQAVAALQLEKFLSSKNAERWCKIMSPGYPAAAYWLCQEARILQEFNHTHPFVARFIGVDTERRILVTEAPGYTLSQWLTTPQGALDHPFQRSSDLLRLLMAVCRIADAIHKKGVIHCGLRPDAICINIDSQRRIDYESIRIIDFGFAHSQQHRLEKPLFLDTRQRGADYLSPALKQSIDKDWAAYCQLVGESDKSSWQEYSAKARSDYETTLMAHIGSNHLDWQVDMYSIGYWFSQISLRRIDYFAPAHQEKLPKILGRMQKSFWRGGYRNFEALLHELHQLELDPQAPVIGNIPQTSSVTSLAALPSMPDNLDLPIGAAASATATAPAAATVLAACVAAACAITATVPAALRVLPACVGVALPATATVPVAPTVLSACVSEAVPVMPLAVGAIANVCVVQYDDANVVETLASVPAVGSALYWTEIMPADVYAFVTRRVCPLNVPTGVRSADAATMEIRRQSATVVVSAATEGELVEPLALTAATSRPLSFCTTKAMMTARSLTVDVTV